LLFLAQLPSQKTEEKEHAYGIVMLRLFSHFNFGISSTFINFGTEDVLAEGIQSTYTFNFTTKNIEMARKRRRE